MPVVLRIGPYTFYFYSQENNEPPHIHVRREKSHAKFWLTPIGLAKAHNFRSHEISRITKLVQEHRKTFLEAWNDYF